MTNTVKKKLTLKEKNQLRREKILSEVQKGKSYVDIGKKFGVTKQRVQQLAKTIDFSRRVEIRETKQMTFEKIMIDFKMGASIAQLTKKYNLSIEDMNYIFKSVEPEAPTLTSRYRVKRNAKIVDDFKNGATASSIVKDKSKILDDPRRILAIDTIYKIVGAQGVKRYKQIGNRSAGGIFEKKAVLKLIVKLHDNKKEKHSFEKIANILNDLGHKTVQGRNFTTAMVRIKYHKYKKELI